MKYECQMCGYIYDEDVEKVPFSSLPDNWTCPMCGAPKNLFEPKSGDPVLKKEDTAKKEEKNIPSEDGLSPLALSVLFSNLKRGAEKQYKEKEAELFGVISDYFLSKSDKGTIPDVSGLSEKVRENLNSYYPTAMEIAKEAGDRGALRALTWAEKVERMIDVLLSRYEKEGEAFLENTNIWVCSVCGFIFVGDSFPQICPVCKVPGWKFDKIV